MYIIHDTISNYYYKIKPNKIIVFNDEKAAYNYIESFYEFALNMGMGLSIFTNPDLMNNIMQHKSATKVIPLPADFKEETINFADLTK